MKRFKRFLIMAFSMAFPWLVLDCGSSSVDIYSGASFFVGYKSFTPFGVSETGQESDDGAIVYHADRLEYYENLFKCIYTDVCYWTIPNSGALMVSKHECLYVWTGPAFPQTGFASYDSVGANGFASGAVRPSEGSSQFVYYVGSGGSLTLVYPDGSKRVFRDCCFWFEDGVLYTSVPDSEYVEPPVVCDVKWADRGSSFVALDKDGSCILSLSKGLAVIMNEYLPDKGYYPYLEIAYVSRSNEAFTEWIFYKDFYFEKRFDVYYCTFGERQYCRKDGSGFLVPDVPSWFPDTFHGL